ncbi:hypothetical protein Dimus_020809 [Dionaea muscipula]
MVPPIAVDSTKNCKDKSVQKQKTSRGINCRIESSGLIYMKHGFVSYFLAPSYVHGLCTQFDVEIATEMSKLVFDCSLM